MNIALESFPAGVETAPLFKGLPDDRCQCPHWGYVVKGRVRVIYKDRDEVLKAGDAYYLAPGHTTVFEEPTELVEFSPKGEYLKTLEVVAHNFAMGDWEAEKIDTFTDKEGRTRTLYRWTTDGQVRQ